MNWDLAPVIERFADIAQTVLASRDAALDPGIHSFYGPIHTERKVAARYVRYHADLMRPGWPTGDPPVVVDAGSGFGFSMIVAALLGASEVRGVEIWAPMVQTVQTYLPLLPADVAARMKVERGDVSALPYPDASADLMLSVEAISHYLDVDAFLNEARRVLRPGGVLVIVDGNNGSNPRIRRKTHEIWHAAECGPAGREVHGHRLGTPYSEVRRRFLDERFPAIPEETRAHIALRTAGYTTAQLTAAAEQHLDSGSLPDSEYRFGQLAISPAGVAMERLFAPRRLARELERWGFDARAYGYWGGAGGQPLVRIANRALTMVSPLTMSTAPSFRIIARRRREDRHGARRLGGVDLRNRIDPDVPNRGPALVGRALWAHRRPTADREPRGRLDGAAAAGRVAGVELRRHDRR